MASNKNNKSMGFNISGSNSKYGFKVVPNESVLWHLRSPDGTDFGAVSYGAYKAVESGNLDSYTPKNNEEKDIINKFKNARVYTLSNQDVEYGNITYKTYQELLNGNMDYKPDDIEEQKIIEEFKNTIGYGKTGFSVSNEYQKNKYGKGNIDLTSRAMYKNPDGKISTVRSMSINEDGKEILIPTVVKDQNGNAKLLSDEEAIKHYHDTGEYLGKFDSVNEANKYAQKLHVDQDLYYDFKTYSQYKPTSNGKKPVVFQPRSYDHTGMGVSQESLPYYTETGFDDIMHDYINRNPDAIERVSYNEYNENKYLIGADSEFLKQMTDDEIATYNYIYNKYGKEKGEEYIKALTTTLNARQREDVEKKLADFAREHKITSSVGTVMVSPMKMVSTIGTVFDYVDDGKIDQNAGYMRYTYGTNAVMGAVSDEIQNSWAGGLGSFLYNTTMSMGDSAVASVFGGGPVGSALIMGSGAFASSVLDAKDRGLSDSQAMLLGVSSAAIEAATEYFSFKKLKEAFTRGKSAGKAVKQSAGKYIIDNIKTNAKEELSAEVLNFVADIFISKDLSNWQQQINKYKKEGKSDSEAWKLAVRDTALQFGSAALAGAISGAGLAGGSSLRLYNNISNVGKANSSNVMDVIAEGLSFDKNSEAYKNAVELFKNHTDTDYYHIGQQVLLNETQKINDAIDKGLSFDKNSEAYKHAKKLNKSKNITGVDIATQVLLNENAGRGIDNIQSDATTGGVQQTETSSDGNATISVGDVFTDTRTGNTIRVVRQIGKSIVVESVNKNGKRRIMPFTIKQLQKAIKSGQVTRLGSTNPTASTTVAENTITTENSTTPTTPQTINLKRVGNFYEVYGSEAVALAQALDNMETDKVTVNGVATDMLRLPANLMVQAAETMGDEFNFNFSDRASVETTSTTDENVSDTTEADVAVVVDAVNKTLRDGALEEIYASMEKQSVTPDLSVWAGRLIEVYKKDGNINRWSGYFTDGGAKVISAIESTMDTTADTKETVSKTETVETDEEANNTGYRVAQSKEVLQNEQESDIIDSKESTASKVESEENANEQRRSDSLYGNGKRRNNGGSRKQTERLLSFRRKNQGRDATERQNIARELIERGQTEEVTDGPYKYTRVKPESYNDEMLAMAENAIDNGLDFEVVVGDFTVEVVLDDGRTVKKPLRGLFRPSLNKMMVKYDHATTSPQQIYKHEYIHAKWFSVAIQNVKETILNSLSESEKNTILSQERYKNYLERYKNEDLVWQEFVCDVMAGMNDYTAKYIDTVESFWNENLSAEGYNPSTYAESTDAGGKYSFDSEENDIDVAINQSMTMEQAKDMIQRAFVIGGIKEWFDGEYQNGDEWLKGEGADAVALVVENEWTLQQKFLDKVQGVLNGDFYAADIIEAYEKGTLTGKVKENVVRRLDTSKSTKAKDTRVFAPKEIKNAQEIYKVASERVTNSNRDKVYQARADIIMFAHNRGAAEALGLTQSELNKKLSTWARYSARAKEASMNINKDVALFNKWTGIENSNLLNRATVNQAELENLVNEVKGDSNGWQRNYIMRTMLALDTHIDYSELNFEFVGTPKTTFGKSVNGLYDNSKRKITAKHNAPHTVAHEMGHFIDYQWARDLGITHSALTEGFGRDKQTDADVKQFLTNFDEFIEKIENSADLRSEYTMDRKEVFARFVSKFVQWVDIVANGKRNYPQEYLSYNDKFNTAHFVEFVRLLQEKSMIDSKRFEADDKNEARYSFDEDEEQILATLDTLNGVPGVLYDNGKTIQIPNTDMAVLRHTYKTEEHYSNRSDGIIDCISCSGRRDTKHYFYVFYTGLDGTVAPIFRLDYNYLDNYINEVRKISEELGYDRNEFIDSAQEIHSEFAKIKSERGNGSVDVDAIANSESDRRVDRLRSVERGRNSNRVTEKSPNDEFVSLGISNEKNKVNDYSFDEDFNLDDYSLYDLEKMSDEKIAMLYEALGLDDIIFDELTDSDVGEAYGGEFSIDDISEELNVEPKKIEILIRRNGLGTSHVEENRTAVMTQERIERDIDDSGSSNPTYARKYITRISPTDFIDLTVNLKHMDRENFDTEVEGDSGSTMGDVDYASALRNSKQTPYLDIDRTTGKIIGHNGRHRIRALEMAGIESVEIEVQFYDDDGSLIKYNAETIPDMAISSQFNTAIETHISNIIPLNESHREEIERNYGEKAHANADIKYDFDDAESEYLELAKDPEKNEARLREMVDEAAKEAGYTIRAMHSTDADFTVFDVDKTSEFNYHGKGIYFSNSQRDVENNYEVYNGPDPWGKIEERAYDLVAEKYGLSYEDTLTSDPEIVANVNECFRYVIDEFTKNVKRINAYLKFDRPLVLEKGERGSENYNLQEYDGIIDKQVYEKINHVGMDENTIHYVVFNPRNIKSAEPVTYDDDGNVIPLSERFNTEKDDIRWDLDESENSLGTQKKIESIAEKIDSHGDLIELAKQNTREVVSKIRENKSLQKRLDNAKRQMLLSPTPAVNPVKVGKITKEVLSEVDSTLKATDLKDRIMNIYNEYFAEIKKAKGVKSKTEDANMELFNKFSELAVEIANSSQVFVESEDYALLKSYVRNTRIKVPDYAKNEAHYAEFRKSHMGTFNLTNDGLDIDIAYNELCSMFPHLFDAEVTSPADQLYAIDEALEKTKPYAYNPSAEFVEDAIGHIVYRFVSEADGLAVMPKTKAQKIAEKGAYDKEMALEKERTAFEQKFDKQKAKSEATIRKLQKKINDADYVKYWENRLSKEEKAKALKDLREKRDIAILKSKIRNIVSDMKKNLDKSEKAGGYPRELVQAAADVCSAIDFHTDRTKKDGTPTKASLKLDALKMQYDALKNNPNYDFASEHSEILSGMIENLHNRVNGKRVGDLNFAELSELKDILSEISHRLYDARKQIGVENARENAAIGTEIINSINSKDDVISSAKNQWLREMKLFGQKAKSFVLNPHRVNEAIALYDHDSAWWKLYDMINRGSRKASKFTMDANKPFDELVDGGANEVAFYDFRTKNVKTGIKYMDGTDVEIPKSIVCELVMAWERKQGRGHLEANGAKIPDMTLYNKGKTRVAITDGGKITRPITQTDIDRLKSMLDSYDLEWMSKADDLFNKVGKDAINETSMELLGRELATAENYIRLYVDEDFVAREIDGERVNATLESHGSLKETKPGAKQTIVLRGLHENVYDHIDFVSKYYGLAIPIRNFNKVYNMSLNIDGDTLSVRGLIGKKFGSDIRNNVVEQLIRDLQAPRPKSIEPFGKIRGNWLNATFWANIRSTLKQTTSYWTASAIVGEDSLVKGLAEYIKHSKKTRAEIGKYSGTLYKRSQGLSTTELGDRANRNRLAGASSKLTKFINKYAPILRKIPQGIRPGNWLQSMDCTVAAALWEACKVEVSKSMNVSDEGYFKAVTDMYERVIEETQSNYDVAHRPEALKNTNALVRAMTMFQTDNLQQSGIIYNAFGDYQTKAKAYEKDNSSANQKAKDEAKKRLAKAVRSRIYSSLWLAFVTMLGDMLLRKFKPYMDDEEKDITSQSVLERMMLNMCEDMVGVFVPVAGQLIGNAADTFTKGYDFLTEPSFDAIQEFIEATSKVWDSFSEGKWEDVKTALVDAIPSASNVTGIPAKNITDLFNAIKGYVGDVKESDFAHDITDYGSGSKSFYSYGDLASCIVSGDTEKETKILDYYSANDKEIAKASLTKEIKTAYVQMYIDSPKEAYNIKRKLIVDYDYSEDAIDGWFIDEYLDNAVSDPEYATEINNALKWNYNSVKTPIKKYYKDLYKGGKKEELEGLQKALSKDMKIGKGVMQSWEKEADNEVKNKQKELEAEKKKYE